MQAVLYVAHGSRVKAGINEAIQFLNEVKKEVDSPIQEICFLELAEPNILQGIESCVNRGASKIAVVPILLLKANHANEDIPQEVEKGMRKYPNVTFTYGKPFGINDLIIKSLNDRIQEQKISLNEDAEVLLIGRGSSDPQVLQDFTSIGQKLQTQYHYSKVNICFLYGLGPSFEQTLQQINRSNKKTLYIVPYLLFTGLLKQSIQKKIEESQFSDSEVILCECLGYDKNIKQVLVQRVYETFTL